MPSGPGKYDHLCTYVRVRSEAHAVAIVVIGGNKGNGFSIQAEADLMPFLPDLLETIARTMRGDLEVPTEEPTKS